MQTTRCIILLLCLVCSVDHRAQTFKEGQSSVNLYYGVTLINSLVRTISAEGKINVQSSTSGPMGLTYEYLLAKRLGIGLEAGYTKSEISYQEEEKILGIFYSFRFNSTYTRIQMRTNFHLLNNENFDIYALFNFGYSGIKTTYVTDDPYYIPDFKLNIALIGLKVGMGFRYFITKNIGLHSEVAIGTPVLSGGLSVRF